MTEKINPCSVSLTLGPPPPCDVKTQTRKTITVKKIRREDLKPAIQTRLEIDGLRPYVFTDGKFYMIDEEGAIWGTKDPQGRMGVNDFFYTPPPEGVQS